MYMVTNIKSPENL